MTDLAAFEIAAWSLGAKLFTAACGLVLIGAMGRVFDNAASVRTKAMFDLIEGSPNSAAIYKGLERLGMCLLLGLILG